MARGVHGRSGPPPDPHALAREHDSGDWTTLPAEGRQGEAPEWPLDDQTAREVYFWCIEWARPQALMWERNQQHLEVAMYVRAFAVAEKLDASVASRTLIRQMQEALGISVPGLARNRWRIADEAPARASQGTAHSRFKVVTSGAA